MTGCFRLGKDWGFGSGSVGGILNACQKNDQTPTPPSETKTWAPAAHFKPLRDTPIPPDDSLVASSAILPHHISLLYAIE